MTTISAVETLYKSIRFRSRLEARWAVFFDTLGIQWEYEKEGFNLGEAGCYLPDFWLPDFDCWVEIKADKNKSTDAENNKCASLAVQSGKFVYMFGQCAPFQYTGLDDNGNWRSPLNDGRYFSPTGERDGLIFWGFCDGIKKVTLGWWGTVNAMYDGRNSVEDTTCEECCYGEFSSESHHDNPKIIDAFNAARSARFEHGESGAK